MSKITKNMVIEDVLTAKPELVETFFAYGLMCIGCPASRAESIEQASMVHGIDCDALVQALNEAIGAQSVSTKRIVYWMAATGVAAFIFHYIGLLYWKLVVKD